MLRNSLIAAVLLTVCLVGEWIGDRGVAAELEKSETFRSPAFELGPGDVIDVFLPGLQMPKGHIALRGLFGQVVLEDGTPVPLTEGYLHHWLIMKFFVKTGEEFPMDRDSPLLKEDPNSGTCETTLTQWYGLGSETRGTNNTVPPPYGIPTGDPATRPEGYDDMWVINIHAIDTRGAVDRVGCTECHCELYTGISDNLPEGYEGGLKCCINGSHCAVKPDFQGPKVSYYIEYTVTYVPMSEEVVPVRIFILDVTDRKSALEDKPDCSIEYHVAPCPEGSNDCIHTQEGYAFLPDGGDLVYAVAHQHAGGRGCSLYRDNGDEICSSEPKYGQGTEAGNEAGLIVGMTSCYPKPGSLSIRTGEKLTFKSFYENESRHTGAMGVYYLLITDNEYSNSTLSAALRAQHNPILE